MSRLHQPGRQAHWRGQYTHVPIRAAVAQRKKIDPDGWLWNAVLASTGQPHPLV
jgi:6-phosphofructokinase 1